MKTFYLSNIQQTETRNDYQNGKRIYANSNSPLSILHAQTRCRSVHACGFTAGQKNRAARPSGRCAVAGRGPRACFQQNQKHITQKRLGDMLLAKPKMFLVEERHEIRDIEKIAPAELDGYLSQSDLAARTKTGKDQEPGHLSAAEFWLVLNAI